MAKKGGKRGASSAARSAAAKKGWETRRRGGAAAKAKPTAPSKPKAPPKTTTARGRARTAETRARAAVKAGGGLRAARSLAVAQRARDWYKSTGTGTKRSKTRSYAAPASNIRRTGGLSRPATGNGIRRTTGPRRAPMATKQNAIRTYRPPTRRGRAEQAKRQLGRAERNVLNTASKLRDELKRTRPQRDALMREVKGWQMKLERRAARDIANSSKPGVDGRIARISLSATPGSLQRAARGVIRRRAARAAAAAARGSKAGARALGVYDRQLAPVLPGKASKAKNSLRPGPRNTKGAPKKRRRRKG